MTARKITLGGKDYEFKPLNLGQMKAVGIGSAKQQRKASDPAAEEANWYDGSFDVIAAALGKTVDEVMKIEGVTLPELLECNRTIFESCGLIKVKPPVALGSASGEATGAAG